MTPTSVPSPSEKEFLELKSFFHSFMELANATDSQVEIHLFTVLDEIEIRAPKRSLAGMRMAVNDCMEMSSHWTVAKVKAVDASLSEHGILTLSEVRRRFSKKVSTMLSRGRIRSEVEYYIVAAVLADQSSQVSETDRCRFEAMAAAYETRAA